MRSVTHEKAGEPAQGKDPNGTLLQVRGLCASYGKHRVLSGVDLDVRRGEFLGLLGHNGAGKTTLLRCVLGLMAPTAGAIRVEGKDIGGHSPAAVVARGISMVPQGDTVFPRLTVQEHLRLSSRRRGGGSTWDVVFDLFPILKERRHRPAGARMNGGHGDRSNQCRQRARAGERDRQIADPQQPELQGHADDTDGRNPAGRG